MEASASGDALSVYRVETGIAASHATAASTEETKWEEIVHLYDVLMTLRPSPVVALSRAMALAERDGPIAGLEARSRTPSASIGTRSTPAAIGELEMRRENFAEARAHFGKARDLARNDSERRFLDRRVSECERAR